MATFTHTLGVLVEEMERLELAIKALEQGMHHASPATITAIRKSKQQLDGVMVRVMEADMTSTLGLQELLTGHRVCMQDCFDWSVKGGTTLSTIGRTRIV
jgi:uncharacterized protein YdcH (DUF465 family)